MARNPLEKTMNKVKMIMNKNDMFSLEIYVDSFEWRKKTIPLVLILDAINQRERSIEGNICAIDQEENLEDEENVEEEEMTESEDDDNEGNSDEHEERKSKEKSKKIKGTLDIDEDGTSKITIADVEKKRLSQEIFRLETYMKVKKQDASSYTAFPKTVNIEQLELANFEPEIKLTDELKVIINFCDIFGFIEIDSTNFGIHKNENLDVNVMVNVNDTVGDNVQQNDNPPVVKKISENGEEILPKPITSIKELLNHDYPQETNQFIQEINRLKLQKEIFIFTKFCFGCPKKFIDKIKKKPLYVRMEIITTPLVEPDEEGGKETAVVGVEDSNETIGEKEKQLGVIGVGCVNLLPEFCEKIILAHTNVVNPQTVCQIYTIPIINNLNETVADLTLFIRFSCFGRMPQITNDMLDEK